MIKAKNLNYVATQIWQHCSLLNLITIWYKYHYFSNG